MTLTQEITAWIESGMGCPMKAVAVDLGVPGCRRPAVIIKHAGLGDTNRFHDEFDTMAQARRSASAVNSCITRVFNKVMAERILSA